MHDTEIKAFEAAQTEVPGGTGWHMWLQISDDPTKKVKLQMEPNLLRYSLL
jgi:hypothetical protein